MDNIKTIIESTYEKSKNIIATAEGSIGSINTYCISDEIIRNTGRFCENYLSDCIITINHMTDLCQTPVSKETSDILCFGLRKNGVDSNGYIQSRIESEYESHGKYATNAWIDLYYRRIFAVKITRKTDKSVICELKNISNDIRVDDDKLY